MHIYICIYIYTDYIICESCPSYRGGGSAICVNVCVCVCMCLYIHIKLYARHVHLIEGVVQTIDIHI